MIYSETVLKSLGIPTDGLVYYGDFPPYNPQLIGLARELRTHGTKSEAIKT